MVSLKVSSTFPPYLCGTQILKIAGNVYMSKQKRALFHGLPWQKLQRIPEAHIYVVNFSFVASLLMPGVITLCHHDAFPRAVECVHVFREGSEIGPQCYTQARLKVHKGVSQLPGRGQITQRKSVGTSCKIYIRACSSSVCAFIHSMPLQGVYCKVHLCVRMCRWTTHTHTHSPVCVCLCVSWRTRSRAGVNSIACQARIP